MKQSPVPRSPRRSLTPVVLGLIGLAAVTLASCGGQRLVEVGQTVETRTAQGDAVIATVSSCSPYLLVMDVSNSSPSSVNLSVSMGEYNKDAGTMLASWEFEAPPGPTTVKLSWDNATSDYGDFGDELSCSNLSMFEKSA